MKLKVCGMTLVAQVQQLEAMQVDYAGFIFYDKSKRYAYDKLLPQKEAIQKIVIDKVGVFVNAGMDFLKSCVAQFGLNYVQLHGSETPEYCSEVQQVAPVIKVFRISNQTAAIDALVAPFQAVCSYFLFDTDTPAYGGSGKRFDWNILQAAHIGKPFFLSGGIGPDAVSAIAQFRHPYFHALDVNSCFETEAGVKNMALISQFKNSVHGSEVVTE